MNILHKPYIMECGIPINFIEGVLQLPWSNVLFHLLDYSQINCSLKYMIEIDYIQGTFTISLQIEAKKSI